MKSLTLLLVLISQFSFAQNHLKPPDSFFDIYDYQFTYYQKIKEVLLNGLNNNPTIRMIVLPSFEKEYVIQIEEDIYTKGQYCIILTEPQEGSIWERNEGNTTEIINTNTYQSYISKDNVELIKSLYIGAIMKTKFSVDDSQGLDGTTYHLTVWDYEPKSAQVWSPRNPNLKEFISIMEIILEKTKKEKEFSIPNELKNSILELTKKFNKKLTLKEIEFLYKLNQSITKIENQYPLFMEVSESFTKELEKLYENIEESINLTEIQYSEIDKIILDHKKKFDRNSFGIIRNNKEFEKLLKEDNPFIKLINIYKSEL